MAQDSTRRLLKVFGIAIRSLNSASAFFAPSARAASSHPRSSSASFRFVTVKEVIALVERLSERAAKL
ncbi:MAG TPA: hypothetical protein VNQ15_18145 [Verrucomicrobiae bacterium]|nr:hypothetical protein [Verrucomicrobiae bacterium]